MEDDIISSSLWWLNLFGLDPTKLSWIKRTWNGCCLASLSCATAFVLMALNDVDNLDGVVEVFDSICPYVQSILKIAVLMHHKDRILEILKILKQLQFLSDLRNDSKFRTKYYVSKKFLVILRASYCSAVFLMVGKTIYLGNRNYPIRVWSPSGLSSTGFAFYFVYISVTAFMLILAIAAFDGFYVAIITHIVGQIGYFNDCLKNMHERDNLKELIDRHNVIYDCISNIQQTFGTQLLYQLVSNTGNICMGLTIINIYGFNNINSLIHLIMVGASLEQLFIFCFLGYQVALQLEDTTFSIYESTWWKHTKRRKAVYFMMMRANRINRLTIGGLFDLNLETFTEVVKKSFSFYALLSAQREES